jgi:pimeloyl-ACP methyl ester carboxylesterase
VCAAFAASVTSKLPNAGKASTSSTVGHRVRALALIAPPGHAAMQLPRWVDAALLFPLLPMWFARRRSQATALCGATEWEAPHNCPHFAHFVAECNRRATAEQSKLPRALVLSLQSFPFGRDGEVFYSALGKCSKSDERPGNSFSGDPPVIDATGRSRSTDAEVRGESMHEHPIPFLLLWGRCDTTVPFAGAYRIKALVPHAHLITYDSAGHVLPLERPAEVAADIASWMRALSTKR